MATQEWFYLDSNKQQIGPLSNEELAGKSESGEIQDTTKVWKDGMPDWDYYSKVKPTTSNPEPPLPKADARNCPYCGAAIKKAARICKSCKKNVPPIVDTIQPGHTPDAAPINFKLPLVMYSVFIGLYFVGVLAFTRFFDYDTRQFLQIVAPISVIVIGILAVVFCTRLHYFCWKAVPEKNRPFTPHRAVGFLFIPAYNLYWVFESFPKLANCLNDSAPHSPKKVSYGLGLTLAILFVLGFLVNFASAQDDDYYVFSFLLMIAEFVIWLLFYRTAVEVAESIHTSGGE